MERVNCITTEFGDDLILSFAVQDRDEPSEIESLTLMRTPKYEIVFDEHERGVSVSFERNDLNDELLKVVEYQEAENVVRIQTSCREYELDVSKIDEQELKEMGQVLRKMNFDDRFQISGIK